MSAVPNSTRVRAPFFPFRVSALRGSVEQGKNLRAIGVFVSSGLQSGPERVYQVQHEREAELTRIEVVAASSQSHDGAHQIVRRDGHEQLLLHHAFRARGNVV